MYSFQIFDFWYRFRRGGGCWWIECLFFFFLGHERIDEQTKKTSDTDLPTNQKNEEPTRHDEAQPGSLSNTFNKFDRPQHQISNHKSQARRDLEPKG